MRVALVHDWLDTWRGGENVLAETIGIFHNADVYSLVDFLPDEWRERVAGKRVTTSFLQHLPFARSRFRHYLPLMPWAIESLDVSGHDVVISTAHAVAGGVRTGSDQLHISYCFTPMRYAWDLSDQYLAVSGIGRGPAAPLVRALLSYLRRWDLKASKRVDRFVGISEYIRDRIRRCYGRDADVIYPPVDVDYYTPGSDVAPPAQRDYYVTASRWVPYKRVDAIAGAFRALPDRRLVVVGDGPEARHVREAAEGLANVNFVGEVPRDELRGLLRGARAFLFAAEEDFGILPVEAQACGTPVIAFGKGGATETVIPVIADARAAIPSALSPQLANFEPTGAFFFEQTPEAIAAAVVDFDRHIAADIDPAACRTNAERFSAARFRQEMRTYVTNAYGEFRAAAR